MIMAKAKLRKIVIDGNAYLWSIKTKYLQKETTYLDYHTQIQFTAYLEGCKVTPVSIHFATWEDAIAGNPLTSAGAGEMNLNKPSLAKVLIQGAISKGWDARTASKTIENGTIILEAAGYDISKLQL